MSQHHTGSCLCGQVRYQLTGEFKKFFLCHCSRCRKTSGTSHCANLFAPGAELTWLSGADNIHLYRHPESNFARAFCQTCGSNVPIDAKARGLVVVPAGSLDSDLDMKAQANIFMGSKGNWDVDLNQAPCFDAMPS